MASPVRDRGISIAARIGLLEVSVETRVPVEGGSQRLVDLPGYGFAKVPLAVKLEWTKQLENYLQKRECLRGLILLMDVRHPMQPFDRQMLDWALVANMPVHILLTKSDKLKKGPATSTLLKVRAEIQPRKDLVSAQLFSSLKHTGHEHLLAVLNGWLTA